MAQFSRYAEPHFSVLIDRAILGPLSHPLDETDSPLASSRTKLAWTLISPAVLSLMIFGFAVKFAFDTLYANYALSLIDFVGIFGVALVLVLSVWLRRQMAKGTPPQCMR
jgi:hypothetical protein